MAAGTIGFDPSTAKLEFDPFTAQPEGPTYGAGQGFSDIVRGAASIPAAVADLPYNAINLGKMAYGVGASAFGRPDLAPDVQQAPFGPMVQNALTSSGVPDTNQDYGVWGNIIHRATQATAAILTGAGVMRAPLSSLSSVASPASVQAIGGELASQTFPGNQAAEIIGQMIPAPGARTVSQGQANARIIREAGGNPTVNQTRGGFFPGFIEGALGRAPGGDYATYQNAMQTNQGMGASVKNIASDISSASSPMQAGRSIQKGIDKFVRDFSNGWDSLDTKVAQHFQPDEGVPVSQTLAKLDEMIAGGTGAEKSLSAVSGSKRDALIKLRDAIASDAQNGALPYQGFRSLRSEVGANSASANLMSDIPTSAYKGLYEAMSQDLRSAAEAKSPEALKALDNQNAYWKAGRQRIDDVLDPLIKNKPEDIYAASIAGTDKGATSLWALRRSLPSGDWKDFVSTFVDRMGKANPGQQSAEGDVWSAQKFLTDWNKLSPQAKNALFSAPSTPNLKQNLDTVAKASELVSKSGKMYANPSGTTPLALNIGAAGAAGGAIVSGSPSTAAWIVGGAGANYVTQRLMQAPWFVDFMARATKASPEKLPSMLSRLSLAAERANDPQLKRDTENYINAVQPSRWTGGIRG